jgi:hypothetical protein
VGDPFRGDENAALIRAARLEEENERLRKELEEARRPKPPEEPEPKEAEPPKTKTDRPTRSAYAITCIIIALVIGCIAVLSTGRSRAQRMRDARLAQAKTLAPSPTIPTATAQKPPPDWVEDKHATETDIRAVTHGVTPAVNYAVGASGMIMRRYGTVWSFEQSATGRDLHGVAEQLGKVCAVGDGGVAVCALDPTQPTWKAEKTGTTNDLLWLTQSYGFLAVGRKGTIVHRSSDGTWERKESGTKENLFGASASYIVGAHGTILEEGESGWRKVPSPTTADLYAVESHLHEVVIVGAGGVILQLGDPRAGFQLVSSPVTTDLYAVAHGGGFEVYAAGAGGVVLVSSGGSGPWTKQNIDTQRDLHTIDAWLPTMFIAGDHGTILSHRY